MSSAARNASSAGRMAGRSSAVRLDTVTIALVLAIVLMGLVMVTSASISIATKETGNPFLYLERQLLLTLMGIVGAAAVFCVRTELLEKLALPLLATAAVLLLLVLVPGIGHSVNGGRRWLRLAGFNLQVSEVARVLVLVFIASYAVRREAELRETFGGLLKPLGLLLVFFVLLLLEPDFGAATVLFATGFGVLFLAGARLRDVVVLAAGGATMLAVVAMSSSYRVRRLTAFLDPWADPFNSGFQLTQSLIAIGRGEWFGVGLGESVQKLFYLPEAHTDFVFAVLVEELGFVGASIVIALFGIVVYRAIALGREALQSGMPFQGLVAIGIGVMLGFEAFVNIGVNSGLLPTKGLALPLISYGRSSTVTTLVALGLLLRIHREVYGGSKRLVQRGYVR